MKMENKSFNEQLDMLNSTFKISDIGHLMERISKYLSAKQQIYFIKMMKLRIETVLSQRLSVIEMCQTN